MPDKKLPIYYSFLSSFLILLLAAVLVRSFYQLDYSWDFSVLAPYIWLPTTEGGGPGLFLKGLWITIKMSFEAIIFGTILGVIFGMLLTTQEKIAKFAALFYVDVFRNTPVLVQLYVAYFIVGTAFNLSGAVAGVLTMSLFCSAYVAEIFRGTIANFEKGQIDAAKALGLSPFQIARKVIAPQALRNMLPPLIGQFVSLIKDSSLLSVVAIPELTKEAQNAVTVTFRSFETWFFIALLYFVVNTLVSSLGRYLEKRLSVSLKH
ncbi:ABC transporter permease subunit [Silvanigrella paludirubra]|uniref:Putative glutamine transport system permease protein GlnP n=1 Tax=Silvanigrella paludirubra TaxID=2499159 RepID=A0A6N6VWZ7_9BACT|nr:amino acid ABC transporter permease [Silvanigrella paludirubra]KAB8041013.1 ABC transporter permease subunit [Silvanigrella paludirubra]